MSKRVSSMVNPRGSVDGAAIVTPHDAHRLRQACPDLDNWPNSWSYDQPDLAVGQRIIEVLTPFLLDLHAAPATLHTPHAIQ